MAPVLQGFKHIHESDMLLIPDPGSAFITPFIEPTTGTVICEVVNPLTRENFSRQHRSIARKAENYLRATSIADTDYTSASK